MLNLIKAGSNLLFPYGRVGKQLNTFSAANQSV